jgi:hypothetical protein
MRKAIFVLILSIIFAVGINAQSPAPIVNSIHTSLIADKATPETCRKWYVVYKGMYIYLKELDGQNTTDFEQVFTKLRLVRDKIQPAKGSVNFSIESQKLLDKYKETDYKPETRTDLAEDILYIADGLKGAIQEMEK